MTPNELIAAMVAKIDEQIVNEDPARAMYFVLDGFSDDELRTIRLFVRSFINLDTAMPGVSGD